MNFNEEFDFLSGLHKLNARLKSLVFLMIMIFDYTSPGKGTLGVRGHILDVFPFAKVLLFGGMALFILIYLIHELVRYELKPFEALQWIIFSWMIYFLFVLSMLASKISLNYF